MANSMPWFKLHSQFRNDPKFKRFSKEEKYDFIVLLCLASESKERGVILVDEQSLSDELDLSIEETQSLLAKLIDKRIFHEREDGYMEFSNWEDRQYDNPSSTPAAVNQRVKKHREEQKSVTTVTSPPLQSVTERYKELAKQNVTKCNDVKQNVTACNAQEESREEEIREEEIREDKKRIEENRGDGDGDEKSEDASRPPAPVQNLTIETIAYTETDRQKRFAFTPPPIEKVIEVFSDIGGTEIQAKKFFNHQCRNDWIYKGKKDKNWIYAATNWKLEDDERAAKVRMDKAVPMQNGKAAVTAAGLNRYGQPKQWHDMTSAEKAERTLSLLGNKENIQNVSE